ncbi:MAG: hypothetical protein ACYTBV_16915 [Planctomycetota bacterium]|jgi:hypothetical protein
MNGKGRLVGRDYGQRCFSIVSPIKWDPGMTFVWKFNDIVTFLFVFPYLNNVNGFAEKRVMWTNNPYCPKM